MFPRCAGASVGEGQRRGAFAAARAARRRSAGRAQYVGAAHPADPSLATAEPRRERSGSPRSARRRGGQERSGASPATVRRATGRRRSRAGAGCRRRAFSRCSGRQMRQRPPRRVDLRIPRARARPRAPAVAAEAAAATRREGRLRSCRPARRTRTPLPLRPAGRRALDIRAPQPPRRRRATASSCRSRPRRRPRRLRATRRALRGDRGERRARPPCPRGAER